MTFVASTSNSTAFSASLSVTIPAAAQVDDVAWLIIDTNEGLSVTAPAGWTEREMVESSGQKRSRYTKTLVAGDLGQPVSVTGGAGGKWILQLLVFRGVDTAAPEVPVTPATTINDDLLAVPAATTTQVTDQFIVVGTRNPAITSFTPPAGWTTVESAYLAGGGSHQAATAYRQAADAGSVSGAWQADASPATDTASTLVVVNPAVPVTPRRWRFDGTAWVPLGTPQIISGADPAPAAAPLWGAAVDGTGASLAPIETPAGRPLGVIREYYNQGSTSVALSRAAAHIAAGRVPWVSFKMDDSWVQVAAGSADAWATNLGSDLQALGGPVMVTFHHEPEGDEPMSGFVPMHDRLASFMAPHSNVRCGPILTGWNALFSGNQEYELDHLWPGAFNSGDFVAFDCYNYFGTYSQQGTFDAGTGVWSPQPGDTMNTSPSQYRPQSDYYGPLAAWAASKGIAWAIGEFGFSEYCADWEISEHGQIVWLQEAWDSAVALGGCLALAYFSSAYNSRCDWRVHGDPERLAAYNAILNVSPAAGATWADIEGGGEPDPDPDPPAFVGQSHGGTFGTTITVNYSATTVGNVLLAQIMGVGPDTITDTGGHTWTLLGDTMDASAGAQRQGRLYMTRVASPVTSVTATTVSARNYSLTVAEFSGVGDHVGSTVTADSTASRGTVAGGLVFAAGWHFSSTDPDTPATPNTGWTQLTPNLERPDFVSVAAWAEGTGTSMGPAWTNNGGVGTIVASFDTTTGGGEPDPDPPTGDTFATGLPREVFAPDSFWYKPLPPDAPLDPASATKRDFLITTGINSWGNPTLGYPSFALNHYTNTPPIVVVDNNTPIINGGAGMTLRDNGTGPYFNNLRTMFQGVRLPTDFVHDVGGSDGFLIVYNKDTDTYWDFWVVQKDASGWPGWSAQRGHRIENASTKTGITEPYGSSPPYFYYGSNAAGLSEVGGVIKLQELEEGIIPHVINIAVPVACVAHKDNVGISAPATRSDGASMDPGAIQMGQRIRLPAGFDVDTPNYHPVTRAVARAFRDYGAVVMDRAGDISFRCENRTGLPDGTARWNAVFDGAEPHNVMWNYGGHTPFPWSSMQILEPDYLVP